MFLNEAENYIIKEVGNYYTLTLRHIYSLHMFSSDCLNFI